MKLLCLDLSTNSGWSVLIDGKLSLYGNIKVKVDGNESSPIYPQNFIHMAHDLAHEVGKLFIEHQPNVIVIEETNKGKNRYSQKQLEFIHFAVNVKLGSWLNSHNFKVHYLDTSEWRTLLGLSLDKDQRKLNGVLNNQRSDASKKLLKEYNMIHYDELRHKLSVQPGKREQNKIQKEFNIKREKWIASMLKSFRSKIEGKVVGKITVKTLSVNFVNQYFNTTFKKKDNDITDSICLGIAFEKKQRSSSFNQ